MPVIAYSWSPAVIGKEIVELECSENPVVDVTPEPPRKMSLVADSLCNIRVNGLGLLVPIAAADVVAVTCPVRIAIMHLSVGYALLMVAIVRQALLQHQSHP